jgi:pimeloyl-ACP methyl ester carboxylesterase
MSKTRWALSSDGVRVAVHDLTPKGGGDPAAGPESESLIVCHATGFCGRAYQPLADELAGRFHVYALDFRGHGDTAAPEDGDFSWHAMADDLLAAVATISAGRPVAAFGHSLGGGVLLLAEARHPGTLRAALLYEPIVLPAGGRTPLGPDPMSAIARRRRAVFSSKAEALLRYARRPPLNVLQAGALASYVEHGMAERDDGSVTLKCTPESEAATYDGAGKPTVETVSGVATPVVVAVGTTERGWTPAAFGQGLADALPNGRLERHPLLGHFGPLQGPVTVATMILDALAAQG